MGLEQRMNPIIEQYVKEGGGAFVKLSDRSPKDAATERGRIYKFLELPEAKGGGALELSSNAVGLPAVYRAMMGSLKVKSGREALKLLLISFRTLEDVQIRLNYQDKLWELKLVIRQWVDFDIAYELRGFVCNNQFTALSQYYYDCYFDVVAQRKDLIAASVQHYWENEVKGKPPYDSYVIDFTVLPHRGDLAEGELLPVTIVELNPFDEYTDSALFNWKLHRQTLHEGPFTFKIVDHPSVEAKRTWWKRILTTHAESNAALQAAALPHEKDGETAEKTKAKEKTKTKETKKKRKEKKKEKKEKTDTKKKKEEKGA